MRRLKKLLWIGLACWIVITVVRESGLFHFNYYSVDIKSETSATWSDNKSSFGKPLDSVENWREKASDPCNVGFEPSNSAVKVSFHETKLGDSSDCGYVLVSIEKLEKGIMWFPLFKYAHFTATASVDGSFNINTAQDGQLVTTHYITKGQMTVKGTVQVSGISSYLNAKNLVIRHVMEAMYKETRAHLKK